MRFALSIAGFAVAAAALCGCASLDDRLCTNVSGKTGENWSVFTFDNALSEPVSVCVGVSWCVALEANEELEAAIPFDIPQDFNVLTVYRESGSVCETVEVPADAECGQKVTVGRTCN